jgi:AcrR family transcriptional regulator
MASSAQRGRRRLDVDARREQLVRIGIELFSERPYDEVWIGEIAARAGVSRGLLYHYFPTKRDFYVEVVRAASADVRALTEPDPDLPPLERMRAAVDAYLRYAQENAPAFVTLHRSGIGFDPEVRAVLAANQDRQVQRILAEIDGGTDSPALELAIRAWLAVLVSVTLDWLERRQPARDVVRELIVGAFVPLLGAAREAEAAR